MKKLVLVISLLLFPLFATAGKCNNCKVRSLGSGPNYDSICGSPCIFISVTGDITNRLQCESEDTTWHFILDTSTESGRLTFAMLLSAHAADKAVSIGGTQQCNLYSKGETLKFVYFPFQ